VPRCDNQRRICHGSKEEGASQLIFKYSIVVEDAIPVDPAIIIDK
jgi:hypothetical protein